MIRKLIFWRLDVAERQLGVSVEYVRHIVRVSLRAFFKFAKLLSLAECQKALPAAPFRIACLLATQDEDCGTCVQIAINLARKDGVSSEHLRAALNRQWDALPDELADAGRFAEAVVTASGNESQLRETLRRRYGEEALIELALAIAATRTFPIIKRALGYAVSCRAVKLDV